MSSQVTISQPFAATVKKNSTGGNSLIIKHKDWYQNQLNKFKDGEEVTLVVHSKKLKRTEQQNRYWWVYMTQIGSETGHAPEEIHEWAKGKFCTKGITTIFGQPTRIKGSTTELSKLEFGDLIRKVELETGIQSPPTASYGL